MSYQDGAVDVEQRLIGRECHVEHTEERHESGVRLVTTTACFTHSCEVSNVSHVLPVKIFASVVAASSFKEQFQ